MTSSSDREEWPVSEPESCKVKLGIMKNAVRNADLSQIQTYMPEWRMDALAAGCEVTYITDNLRTLLYDAAFLNRSQIASYLVTQGTEMQGYITNAAVKTAAIETLKTFMELGWDVNADDPVHGTALISAINRQNKALVLWLLDQGANPNLRCFKERMNVMTNKSISGTPVSSRPLDFAASSGQLNIFDLLIDRGAELDACNALHYAAADISREGGRRLLTVEFLLEKGMDVNKIELENDEQWLKQYRRLRGTPLHYAAKWGSIPMTTHLISKGAQRDALDSDRDGTPLDWAEWYARDTEIPVEEDLRTLLIGNR
ncbi:MAG: hypothetical protein Q9160_002923 [Pyrenula sp. 1 TL-2023]